MSKRAYGWKMSLLFHSKCNTRMSTTVSTLPSHLFSSSALPSLSLFLASILDLTSLNTFRSNQSLVFCSTTVVSFYSNNYQLVTDVAVFSSQSLVVILTPVLEPMWAAETAITDDNGKFS
ncbi:unnamed protein product [Hymenolepis diminuta]|uniref:Uncharacterized protein n=1 Tax=Hymenolepis diminuta TaxID=6216 RepID=A0A564Z238_HYMDI|nr:unnamed protein product [Hymenolepis diminuta]